MRAVLRAARSEAPQPCLPSRPCLPAVLQGAECDVVLLTTVVTRPGAFASGAHSCPRLAGLPAGVKGRIPTLLQLHATARELLLRLS